MKKVTIYINFKFVENVSLEDILMRIRLCIYGHLIRPLRRQLKEGNVKGYANSKKGLPAFTSSVMIEGDRLLSNIREYNSQVILDFDKLDEKELIRVKEVICLCKYTLACFVSPSGNGLKVLVSVSSGIEDHLNAFLSVQKFYMAITGHDSDPSGKDVTRLCFVSMDEQLYYNPQAFVFETGISEAVADQGLENKISSADAIPVKKVVLSDEMQRIQNIYKRCIVQVERDYVFIEGQRNVFVHALARQMRWSGISESTCLTMLKQDYNFDEKEVCDCVKSAYSYNWSGNIKNTTGIEKTVKKGEKGKGSGKVQKAGSQIDTNDIPTEEDIPDDPPQKSKRRRREQWDIETVEKLINHWYDLRYNEVIGVVEWRMAGSDEPFQRIIDYWENTMYCELMRHDIYIPFNTFHSLLSSRFARNFNPFQDYFNNLPLWDGVTDYIGQLCDTVKTLDDEYFRFCFRKWFVAYVASLLVDDIINHTVIVFIGSQGVGKTSWMKSLVPKEFKNYLGSAVMQADSKDTSIMLSECVLIILDEMESLNRKDLASFKEMITRPWIRVRRPYGHNSENLHRHASFIASVNFEQILTDPSGSRRYLCSKVASINYKHNVDINLCMAQALALFKSGFEFWFDQENIKELCIRNEDFQAKWIEEELIETWMRPVTREEWNDRKKFANGNNIVLMTATEITTKVAEKAKMHMDNNSVTRVGRILKKLNYERIRKGNNYSYMVRLIDAEVVKMNNDTLEDENIDFSKRYLTRGQVEMDDRFNDISLASHNDDEGPF